MEQGDQDGPLREDRRLRVRGAHGPQRQGTGLAQVIHWRQPTIHRPARTLIMSRGQASFNYELRELNE